MATTDVQSYPSKLPGDQLTRSASFAKWLVANDSIVADSQSVAVYLSDGSTPPNLTLTAGAPDITLVGAPELDGLSTSVNFMVANGVAGNTYYFGISVNTVVSAESVTRYFAQPVVGAPL